MEKGDMRSKRRALWAEHGFAVAPEVALRIFDDQEEAGVGRQPPRGSRDAQAEWWHRGGDGGEPLEISRLIDHRHVRFDRRGRLRIPATSKLVDAPAKVA